MRLCPEQKLIVGAGRLLLLSSFPAPQRRATADLAEKRNGVVGAIASASFIAYAASGSKTEAFAQKLSEQGKPLFTFESPNIDVEVVVGKYDWPVKNVQDQPQANHFIVLISYEGKIQDLATLHSVWVLPHADVARFVKEYAGGSRKNLARALINNAGQPYKDAWHLLTESAAIALQTS